MAQRLHACNRVEHSTALPPAPCRAMPCPRNSSTAPHPLNYHCIQPTMPCPPTPPALCAGGGCALGAALQVPRLPLLVSPSRRCEQCRVCHLTAKFVWYQLGASCQVLATFEHVTCTTAPASSHALPHLLSHPCPFLLPISPAASRTGHVTLPPAPCAPCWRRSPARLRTGPMAAPSAGSTTERPIGPQPLNRRCGRRVVLHDCAKKRGGHRHALHSTSNAPGSALPILTGACTVPQPLCS